jgi:hypothetical protein
MLKSSIMGREFVNYRKNTDRDQRNNFSGNVRSRGLGNVPVVIDSVEKEISDLLATKDEKHPRNIKYGLEVTIHMDNKVSELLKIAKIELLKKDYEVNNLVLGLEDGSLIDLDIDVGTVYKKHRNNSDKILYVLVTNEKTMYGYILSIIKYLASGLSSFINNLSKEL